MPKLRSRTAPLVRENDRREMREAIAQLQAREVHFIRPTQYQLKIDDINFYPETGRIQIDGSKALKERGLSALLQIVESRQATEMLTLDMVISPPISRQ